jgi:hypothetical protein
MEVYVETLHKPNSEQLQQVIADMQRLGTAKIRVVARGD